VKVSLVNQTPLFVVLYSVDYESKQERLEVGEVYGSIVPAHASVPHTFNLFHGKSTLDQTEVRHRGL